MLSSNRVKYTRFNTYDDGLISRGDRDVMIKSEPRDIYIVTYKDKLLKLFLCNVDIQAYGIRKNTMLSLCSEIGMTTISITIPNLALTILIPSQVGDNLAYDIISF